MKEPWIRLDSVTLGYGRHVVLEEVTLDVMRGEFFGIIGPNGAGKTTLLRALLGLTRPQSGRVTRQEGLRYGYVVQRQFLDTRFPFTAQEIVTMGTLGPGRAPPRSKLPAAARRVSDAMEVAGVGALGKHLYRELSGGQKQRVLLARALASHPDVLVLDEPTNDMDIQGEERIMTLLGRLKQDRGLTIVLVTHLLHVALNFTERIAFLTSGRVHVHSVQELASGDLLSRIYGIPVTVGEREGKRYLVTGRA